MDRVEVIKNKKSNILVVAPHGIDDTFTPEICEAIVAEINCNCVINRGFARADDVDSLNDKANCNSCDHVMNDPVVKSEFFDPINLICLGSKVYYNQVNRTWGIHQNLPLNFRKLVVAWIHGSRFSTKHDVIVGIGYGKPDSLTMEEGRTKLFIDNLSGNYKVGVGGAGSKYAGWGRDNMNQLFVKHLNAAHESIQIEIKQSLRKTNTQAETIGKRIAAALVNAAGSAIPAATATGKNPYGFDLV